MSIELHNIRAGYGGFRLTGVSARIESGSLTALIGPNGCGKSTLLKTISGEVSAGGGRVVIAGQDIARMRVKHLSRQVAILPQHPVIPPGISVEQLVGYGRAPHQNLLGMKSPDDAAAIHNALEITSLTDMKSALVGDLSGGQRQRAFLAMCIAQDTPYILFDEPTSFLDIRYQVEVLELMAGLHQSGKTVIAVLHDIAQAARYASDLIVMKAGSFITQGTPEEVITDQMIAQVYGIEAHVYPDPISQTPAVSPRRNRGSDI